MKKTVLILGAGASADYGFPLWAGLKKQMLELDLDRELSEVLRLTIEEVDAHKTAFSEFQQHLTREPDATLDRIVFLIDKPKSKHLKPTGDYLINLAGYLLSKIERKKKDRLWVSEFQAVLLDYLASKSAQFVLEQNHLKNLAVISLNYDRVCERFISDRFFQGLIQHSEYNPPSLGFGPARCSAASPKQTLIRCCSTIEVLRSAQRTLLPLEVEGARSALGSKRTAAISSSPLSHCA